MLVNISDAGSLYESVVVDLTTHSLKPSLSNILELTRSTVLTQ